MAPPLKALFVNSNFYMPNAPDELPLSFIIDFTSYVGAASVPLGLILLGTTLARLQVKKNASRLLENCIANHYCQINYHPNIWCRRHNWVL